ncbi:Anaerobic glycerol-3-phosphate dehydrogenase subunit B [Candidatus Lokiarchaeum ossiferum]|uniref:Anaerobic glycerol-3-phosphate dehydrogenase subunit B n=1 Tax=Candidatus Lokiarchaeum ossiferum TaxID=2951803 RepID=A0ABY6HU71_9ARCH|nr:Anaerobic glycerol-3-phosphate dehydrogenase subunit B [Candidatus Lokiarchaeum sp. B-35]
MDVKKIQSDVVVVGGGFSGMNIARILSQNGLSCNLISGGYGASEFWNGTVDLLNYPGDNIELELAKFQVSIKDHPYAKLSLKDIQNSLIEFNRDFTKLSIFQEDDKLVNRHVITPLGTTKLCVGNWNSIFSTYKDFTLDTKCLLIEFAEFPNSTAPLVSLGLKETFPGQFNVLTINLATVFSLMNSEFTEYLEEGKLSALNLAEFFDEKVLHLAPVAEIIKKEFELQFPDLKFEELTHFLFPAVMGLEHTQTILNNLSTFLNTECWEFLVFTPTVLANRLINKMERKLEIAGAINDHSKILVDLTSEESVHKWNCHIRNSDGEITILNSKYVIFATGSIFLHGFFRDQLKMANQFLSLGLDFPESLNPHFEIISSHANSNIFVVGSAIFHFSTNLGEDDEIQDGTGLGMAIATSFKVAQEIIAREKTN